MKVYRTTFYYTGKSKGTSRLAFSRNQFGGILGRERRWSGSYRGNDARYDLGRARVTLESTEIPDDQWVLERDERGPEFEGEVQLELPFPENDLCNVSE